MQCSPRDSLGQSHMEAMKLQWSLSVVLNRPWRPGLYIHVSVSLLMLMKRERVWLWVRKLALCSCGVVEGPDSTVWRQPVKAFPTLRQKVLHWQVISVYHTSICQPPFCPHFLLYLAYVPLFRIEKIKVLCMLVFLQICSLQTQLCPQCHL